jgi:heme-degrading monooxygenase HmoA
LAQEIYRKTRTLKKRRRKIYPVITVWRDRADPRVGDESDHNRALRRQAKALFSDADELTMGDDNYAVSSQE